MKFRNFGLILVCFFMCIGHTIPVQASESDLSRPELKRMLEIEKAQNDSLQKKIEELTQENNGLHQRDNISDDTNTLTNVVSQDGECSALKTQNESLRQTIRAQNEYLLNVDNSGQISQKLVKENNDIKSKAYYLEQATKSSADEIKRLMILNEALQRELSKFKAQ